MRSLMVAVVLTGCSGTNTVTTTCGDGTIAQGGKCVVASAGGSGNAGAGASDGGSSTTTDSGTAGEPAFIPCPAPMVLAPGNAAVETFEAGATSWFLATDMTGKVSGTGYNGGGTESNVGGVPGSAQAAHIFGSGFTSWGIVFGYQRWAAACADLSVFSKISFWAKGKAATGFANSLLVAIPLPGTTPRAEGGGCLGNCYDHYKAAVSLTDDWQQFSLSWEQFSQAGWGAKASFDVRHVQGIQFATAGAIGGVQFDWWLDNIELVVK